MPSFFFGASVDVVSDLACGLPAQALNTANEESVRARAALFMKDSCNVL
jgi:hypothetical protein